MQTMDLLFQNEYIRLATAIGLVCVSAIAVWLLFREIKLWYWKTETVLEALDTISYRLEHVEGRLDYTNQDTLDISTNVHAIAFISEQTRTIQQEISADVKDNTKEHRKTGNEVTEIYGLLMEHMKDNEKEAEQICIPVRTTYTNDEPIEEDTLLHENESFGQSKLLKYKELFSHDEFFEDEFANQIEDLWQYEDGDSEYFAEEDEEEIRSKIRL